MTTTRLFATVVALSVLASCTPMKPSDFANAEPTLRLEEYFEGETVASGIFEDRFGRLRRQFTVDITGRRDGDTIVLDERFRYSDGETDRRIWTIVRTGPHEYEGTADDVVGKARGESYGNALNWRYQMDLEVGDRVVRVHFDDWMFLQPSGMLINRARVTKFGIELGVVTLAFTRSPQRAEEAGGSVSARPHDVESRKAASR